ncbi:hypothetical protein MESS2_220034 [Mesorhizobium metallidurans STM 2683]|uniref:Uncharacterized protein n=1 Tax=Mesorhizobium metallidurans STM 2683 TaxID=1297569 RepID=M5ENZ1_9HYPH|nr:hypothetical protein MESS2_220034 [Mesorhizobium metallidurans STM 2683]
MMRRHSSCCFCLRLQFTAFDKTKRAVPQLFAVVATSSRCLRVEAVRKVPALLDKTNQDRARRISVAEFHHTGRRSQVDFATICMVVRMT